MFDFLRKPKQDNFVNATADHDHDYPNGFFRVLSADGKPKLDDNGRQVLGHYFADTRVHHIPCGTTVSNGSQRITLPVPAGKTLEEVIAGLPVYQLPQRGQTRGVYRIGNGGFIDTTALDAWDGEVQWGGAPPSGIPAGLK